MDVLNIVDVLDSNGLIRKNRVIGNYYSIYCPFHANGQERKPSCGVLLHDEVKNGTIYHEGWFHCFSCGASYTMSEAINIILKTKSIKKSGIDWLKENVPGFSSTESFEYLIPKDMMDDINNKYAISYINSVSNKNGKENYVSEEELASYRYTVPYMYERKLTDEIIEKYDVGVDMNWIPPNRKNKVPCVTFPVRDVNGKTLFICRRSIEGKLYNYPTGVTKPVFGIDMISKKSKSVIICESIFNALTAEVYGYDAVALLGTGNSYQINQLRSLGVNEFVLCMDGDDAGRRASNKLKNALKDVAIIWTINMPDGKDLNDCSKDEFDKLYLERE